MLFRSVYDLSGLPSAKLFTLSLYISLPLSLSLSLSLSMSLLDNDVVALCVGYGIGLMYPLSVRYGCVPFKENSAHSKEAWRKPCARAD